MVANWMRPFPTTVTSISYRLVQGERELALGAVDQAGGDDQGGGGDQRRYRETVSHIEGDPGEGRADHLAEENRTAEGGHERH